MHTTRRVAHFLPGVYMTEGLLPNLVIAGVAKGGTTSLFRYLEQHPDICAAGNKELGYFDPVRYGGRLEPIESYSRHFGHCSGQPWRLEATPGYFGGGRPVAVAMRDTLPNARVVVSLRDPVARCWSWYRFAKSRGRVPKSLGFASYLNRCEELNATGHDGRRANQAFSGLLGGCYDRWIGDWLDVMGERLRLTYFEHLVEDPHAVVSDLLRWLGIDELVARQFRYEVENRTMLYRSASLQHAALAVNRQGERFFAHHPGLKRALRSAYYALNGDSGDERLEPAERARLTDFYAPHNKRLAAALAAAGRGDWPAWLSASVSPPQGE